MDGDDTYQVDLVRGSISDIRLWEPMFRTYYEPLCAYAAGFTRSWDNAEEIVQTVFTTLWDRRDRLGETGNLRAYLYAAVRNEALNARKHRLIVTRAREVFTRGVLEHEPPPGLAEASLQPDTMVERDEIIEQIRTAVAKLPERAREVLTLRWEHSMSYAEIATLLGIHPHSAKQQQSRAIAMLKRQLSGILLPGE